MRGPFSCSFPRSDVETQRVTRSHAETCDIINSPQWDILSPGESFLAKSKAEPASSSSDVSIYTPGDGSLVAQVMPWLCNQKICSSKKSARARAALMGYCECCAAKEVTPPTSAKRAASRAASRGDPTQSGRTSYQGHL